MARRNKALFVIEIDDKGQPAIKRTAEGFKGLETQAARTGKGFNVLKSHWLAFSAAIAAGVFTISKITKGILALADAFGVQEAAENALAVAMRNTGDYTLENLENLKQYAAQLQQVTVYGDETTLSTMANLKAYGMNTEQLKLATRATMDLATAKGIDLRAASELVGKAFVGETGTLSRYGIILDKNVGRTEKFSAVLDLINQRFGGAAQAQIETYQGKVQQLANAWGDLKEAAGALLIPVLEKVVVRLKEIIEWATKVGQAIKSWLYPSELEKAEAELKRIDAEIKRISASLEGTYFFIGETMVDVAATARQQEQIEKRILDLEAKRALVLEKITRLQIDPAKIRDQGVQAGKAYAAGIAEGMELMKGEMVQPFIGEFWGPERGLSEMEMWRMLTERRQQWIQEETDAMNQVLVLYQEFDELATQYALERYDKDRQGFQDLMDFKVQAIQNYFAIASMLTGALYDLTDQQSKALFALSKAAAIAQAIVNAHVAYTQALAWIPPPANVAVAKSMLALGYAQAAAIAATAIKGLAGGGGGGGGAGRVGGYAGGGAVALAREAEPEEYPQNVVINITGDVVNYDDWFEEKFLPTLKSFARRDTEIVVRYGG